MKLTAAHVTNFKSIEDSDVVPIDDSVTVLVGQNESGKTAFLQALHKARPIAKDASYDTVEDYPRKGLTAYERDDKSNPAVAAKLTYELESDDLDELNEFAGFHWIDSLSFSVSHDYNNSTNTTLTLPEATYVQHRLQKVGLATEARDMVKNAESIDDLISGLSKVSLNAEDAAFLEGLQSEFPHRDSWSRLGYYVWQQHLLPRIPEFLYFDDYYLLPGKINLTELQTRIAANNVRPEDKTALSLLRLAGVEIEDLIADIGYEPIKAKLEGISNSITDRVFQYWQQNKQLDVEFDIRTDPNDTAPFNNGSNLYIRIKNRRHRVTVPFSQRSKGFIWFFSFITWFDSIKQEMDTANDLILLLDEPGLSLHALAQADFLRYIDDLSGKHQILYTTHSPFMVHSDRLHQVRTVEDRQDVGTKITSNVSGADPNTVFPLQAALGYTIAQNLFISKRNLLVEGPADLIYLQYFSNVLASDGRTALREDVTIVPVGGLDKLATFVALLRGNELEISVLHDYESKAAPHLERLVREKLLRDKQILNYAMFRGFANQGSSTANLVSTDVEDLISPSIYLRLFNSAYAKGLNGMTIKVGDLPAGDRIVIRIGDYLAAHSVQLRKGGGFNHYLVANYLASNPLTISKPDATTLANFEGLFSSVNEQYSTS